MSSKIMPFLFLLLLFTNPVDAGRNVTVYFVYSDLCPHCGAEKSFLKGLDSTYKEVGVEYLNIASDKENVSELNSYYGINGTSTPQTYVGDAAFIGFNEDADYLLYSNRHHAFLGNPAVIEDAVFFHMVDGADNVSIYDAVDISGNDSLVKQFIRMEFDRSATVNFTGGVYLVAWWNKSRLRFYPDVVVKVNSSTGSVIESHHPSGLEEGVSVPRMDSMLSDFIAYVSIFIYLISYIIYSHSEGVRKKIRVEISGRKWLNGFIVLLIALSILLVYSHPGDGSGYLIKFVRKLLPIYL
ncbi:MAG: hypothetical protein U9M95_06870 [Candidatus Altiarchaeota archaeon]|nr:hypothetical protein [Candidatus Altiarchaeota archaeon]